MSTSLPTVDSTDATPQPATRRIALWVLAVQCLLALSWTMYVLFLPGLLAQAHIDRRWFPVVLMADQAIFAACDWFAGAFSDRIAPVWRRLGRVVTAVTLLSSAALLAMPWIALTGSAVLLLATIFAWAATSSALRAPVFALLGRVREDGSLRASGTRRAGMVGIALVGISLAGAFGPFLTLQLRGLDPRLPLALSALSLAAAGLWALRAETQLPAVSDVDDDDAVAKAARRRAWWLAGIAFVAALGAQSITMLLAPPLLARHVGADAVVWAAWFWAGFGIGLAPGTRLATMPQPFLGAAAALAVAAIVFVACAASGTFPLAIVGLIVAGAGWGVFSTIAFTSAVTISRGRAKLRGVGTASGMLFSAFALATLSRFLFVSSGFGKAPWTTWLPLVAWLAAALLLLLAARGAWLSDEARSPA